VQQGLLLETVRGVTFSSARREVLSGVFAISALVRFLFVSGRGKIGYTGNPLQGSLVD
jgi:hypothetical protein